MGAGRGGNVGDGSAGLSTILFGICVLIFAGFLLVTSGAARMLSSRLLVALSTAFSELVPFFADGVGLGVGTTGIAGD